MNQKPYDKCLTNLVCSVSTGKYLPSVFSHRPRSFIALSVRKPQANTFLNRPCTRLILALINRFNTTAVIYLFPAKAMPGLAMQVSHDIFPGCRHFSTFRLDAVEKR